MHPSIPEKGTFTNFRFSEGNVYQRYSQTPSKLGSTLQVKDEDQFSRTSQRDVRKLIQKALNRKTISQAYHTNVPVFLKSEGPFAIYDHSLRYHKGHQESPGKTVTDMATSAALNRHEMDLQKLKEHRLNEQTTFYAGINDERRQMVKAAVQQRHNMKQNQAFVQMQMVQAREMRE